MNIVVDRKLNTYTIVLEKVATKSDSTVMGGFVTDAFSVPEMIGGIYFLDTLGQEHHLEFKNESLHALLLTVDSIARNVPVTIQYADNDAPSNVWAEFWKLPVWLVSIATRIFRPDMTYKCLFNHGKSRLSISK